MNEDNAGAYLHSLGLAVSEAPVSATALSGGVSNQVILVKTGTGSLVLKQPYQNLHVAEDWSIDTQRVLIECDCLRLINEIAPGFAPQMVSFDEDNLILVMRAVPAKAVIWKTMLMRGEVNPQVAENVGRFLGRLQSATASDPDVRRRFDNPKYFIEGRVAPYYLTAAHRNPDVASIIRREVERLMTVRWSLVHGDFSPKNLFVTGLQPIAIDFEMAHYGDPVFDVAFCLNHLFIKAVHLRHAADPCSYISAAGQFLQAYLEAAGEEMGGHVMRYLAVEVGCLMLARIDGLSPLEYITSESERNKIRELANRLLLRNSIGYPEMVECLMETLGQREITV